MKILSLWDRLDPEAKTRLNNNEIKWTYSVTLITKTLKETHFWQDLTIDQVCSLIAFSDTSAYEWNSSDWKFGDQILLKNE